MGGVFSPLARQPEVVFENPAAIACAGRRFSYSHSIRHFPGKIRNLDQLDADSVALISRFGFLSLGLGFTVAGELGYDYLTRNDFVFPEEKVEGREEVQSLAVGACWLAFGRSKRQFQYRIHQPTSPLQERRGISSITGKIFHILPWLSFSYSEEKASEQELKPAFLRRVRVNWSIKPFPWWLWSNAREQRIYSLSGTQFIKLAEKFYGSEIRIFGVVLRNGNWNRHPTTGFSLPWGQGSLDYAEVKDILSDITGTPLPYFRDVHIGGFTLK